MPVEYCEYSGTKCIPCVNTSVRLLTFQCDDFPKIANKFLSNFMTVSFTWNASMTSITMIFLFYRNLVNKTIYPVVFNTVYAISFLIMLQLNSFKLLSDNFSYSERLEEFNCHDFSSISIQI